MKIRNLFLAGLFVGLLSLIYNYSVFFVFKFYPDPSLIFSKFEFPGVFYLIVFVKNFIVGIILSFLFSVGTSNINTEKWELVGIFFYMLYAFFALVAFSIGDMLLMKSTEGMLVLLTLDGFIESIIATIPIRLFSKRNLYI